MYISLSKNTKTELEFDGMGQLNPSPNRYILRKKETLGRIAAKCLPHLYVGGITMADTTQLGSTKDLKKVLTYRDLMGISIGNIIGAGIMTMVGIGIAMTGRSVNIAFVLSALFTIFRMLPIMLLASCIRLRGGPYTQMGLFAGSTFAGAYSIIFVLINWYMPIYAISFAEYFLDLVPGYNAKVVAIVVATIFFVLNFFGVDLMRKIQNLLVLVLLVCLGLFAVYGAPHIDLTTYFSNADGYFMTNGVAGVLSAGAYLAFACGGAQVLINMSAECKNPIRDIPAAIVSSVAVVAVLYAVISTIAAGVLPVPEVANKTLGLVAKEIFNPYIYVFFVVGGAMFALATSLNSTIMSITKPIMQACEDGWFPKSLTTLHPKYRTPWKLLIFFYLITVIPILINMDINQISSVVLIVGYVETLINTVLLYKLPKHFPEQWKKSPYHMPYWMLIVLLCIASAVVVIQFLFVASTVTPTLLAFNIGVVVLAFVYAWLRYKTGKVHVTISYDLE